MTDYGALTKSGLRDLARERGLAVSGTVEQLVERLQNADPPPPADPPADPDGTLQDLLNSNEQPPAPPEVPEDNTRTPGAPADAEETGTSDTTGPPQPTSQALETPTAAATTHPTGYRDGNEYVGVYPVPAGGLDNLTHQELMNRHQRVSADAGYQTRGTARRTGWSHLNGQRHAIYRIYIR